MKKKETIELIKGSFTADEAREILLQMLNNKIKFHDLKNWSSMERFGKSDVFSEERLKSLKESRKKLEQLLAESISGEETITINSTIEINIE